VFLAQLEREAYEQWTGGRDGFSLVLFSILSAEWYDYRETRIVPTREVCGRGALNPYVLMAFSALDRAKGQAEKTLREREQSRQEAATRRGRRR
jgi:hypothetical protein